MTATIGQLNAKQLARHAFNVFLFSGRHETGAKLIYRAVELDPRNIDALRCLSDLLDVDGTEVFSGVVLEYALSESVPKNDEELKELDDLLFLAKWSWGFSRHTSGNIHLAQEDFIDRSVFVVDEIRYEEFLDQILSRTCSLHDGLKSAHTLCGKIAGILAHETFGESPGIEEFIYPKRFQIKTTYDDWLQSSTEELDSLEEVRKQKVTSNKGWWKIWR